MTAMQRTRSDSTRATLAPLMKCGSLLLLVIALSLQPLPPLANASTADVIVVFRANLDPSQRAAILTQAGAVPRHHLKHVRASSAALVAPDALRRLEAHPDVLRVMPDREWRLFAEAGALTAAPAQVIPAGVDHVGAAPGTVPFAGMGIGVAVVDTGIDFGHADLQPIAFACFTAFPGSCQDDNGHGTHVAGIIGARNNAIDVVGVAPSATLYAVKVLNRHGRGTDSNLLAGLDWIVEFAPALGIRVVNMSTGRRGSVDDDPPLHELIQILTAMNITIVAAAGNQSTLDVSDVSQVIPAAYPEVIAVAGTTATAGSNECLRLPLGSTADTATADTVDGAGIAVSAPGNEQENVGRNCRIKDVGILSTRLGGGTERMSGTSMAAPHVSGVAALLVEAFGDFATPQLIRERITAGAARRGEAPLDSPSPLYTFDGVREGVLSAPGALREPRPVRLYVTNSRSNTVTVIDPATNAVIATVPVASDPRAIVVNPVSPRSYVANLASNSVSVLDTETNSVVGTIVVGTSPFGAAVNRDGTRAYFPDAGDGTLSVVDTTTDSVIAMVSGAAGVDVAVHPSGSPIYVADQTSQGVHVVDAVTNSVVKTIPVAVDPAGVVFHPNGRLAYVANGGNATVAVIDVATEMVVATIGVGAGATGIAINPSGTRVYVANRNAGSVSIIATDTNAVLATASVGASPSRVAVDPTGKAIYVTNFDSDSVSIIDAVTSMVVATIPVGVGPFGVAVTP